MTDRRWRKRRRDDAGESVSGFLERLQRSWSQDDGSHLVMVRDELLRGLSALSGVDVVALVQLRAGRHPEAARDPVDTGVLICERGDTRPRPVSPPAGLDALRDSLRAAATGAVELSGRDPALRNWPAVRNRSVGAWLLAAAGRSDFPDFLLLVGTESPPFAAASIAAVRDLVTVAGAALLGAQDAPVLRRELGSLRSENAALVTLNRTHGQFLAMASHELRTPLTAIIAYTDALLDRLDDTQFRHTTEFLRVVRGEADRLARMTERMLDYSRLGYGKRLLDLQPVAVAPLVDQCLLSLLHRAQQRRQNVETSVVSDLPDIEADADLIRHVLVNLIGNAVKYTPVEGTVRVSAREDAATVRIEVSDSGPGIAPGELRRIFRQFYRTEATATQAEGSGLGLAIVKHIVALHGGHVDVRSRLNEGSTFGVLLPKVPVHSHNATLLSESAAMGGPLRRIVRIGLRMVAELLNVRVAVLAVLDPKREALVIQGGLGLRAGCSADLRVERSVAPGADVLSRSCTVAVPDLAAWLPGLAALGSRPRDRSGLAATVEVAGERVGVLAVGGPLQPGRLGNDERTLFSILCRTLCAALNAATRTGVGNHELAQVSEALEVVQCLRRSGVPTATPLALRLLGRTAQRLGLAPAEVLQLQYIGALHDVGMVRVSEEIAYKRDRLDPDDREAIDSHTEDGARLLEPLLPHLNMREVVRLHHEHMDGSGYPEGRRGDDIPLGARILLVVDAFFAMISERPWRAAMAPAEVVEELQRHAGTQFDGEVVAALVEALRAEGILETETEGDGGRPTVSRVPGAAGTRS